MTRAYAELDELIAKSSIGAGLADIKARGIDARLVDLEAELAPKKKRKSRSTYSARTITECRRRGWLAGNVERRIPFPKPQGTTIDLFGIIDIIAIDLSAPIGQRTIGIQATSGGTGGSHSPHRAKILAAPHALSWLQAGNRLELWSWAKQGARGKAKRWTLRVEAFTVEDWRTA
jgi:hypothetical protein